MKAILFDLDDTLLSRRAAVKRMFQRIQSRWYGAALPAEALGRFLAWDGDGYGSKPDMFAALFAAYPPKRSMAIEDALALWDREFPSCFALPPEHRVWLVALRERYRLAIVTNGATQVQWAKVRQTDLQELVDAVIVSEEAGFWKPDARIFQLALERLGVAPEEALFVGDNLKNDIAGAQAAGMRAVWIRPEGARRDENILPDAEITELTQLDGVLDGVGNCW